MYRKSTLTAFAAMTLLAEEYDRGAARLSAPEIAQRRSLALPFLSKVLTSLVQAGLVDATRGPGGGFALSRPPADIALHEISRLFERGPTHIACPFRAGPCAAGEPCPVHERFASVREAIAHILQTTTLDEFRQSRMGPGRLP